MSLVFFVVATEIVKQLQRQPQLQHYHAQINATKNSNLVMFSVKEIQAVSKIVKLKMSPVYYVSVMEIAKQPQLQRRQRLQQQHLALIIVTIISPSVTQIVMAMNFVKNSAKMPI